jgi:hypothetical protein
MLALLEAYLSTVSLTALNGSATDPDLDNEVLAIMWDSDCEGYSFLDPTSLATNFSIAPDTEPALCSVTLSRRYRIRHCSGK